MYDVLQVDLNKKSQEQATVAIQRAEAIHGLFIETVERLEVQICGIALPLCHGMRILLTMLVS